jgi:hypothetical protein
MFADKLWYEDKNKTVSSYRGKGGKGGCKNSGLHNINDSVDSDFKDDKIGHLRFCPVLASVYIIMAAHFIYFY